MLRFAAAVDRTFVARLKEEMGVVVLNVDVDLHTDSNYGRQILTLIVATTEEFEKYRADPALNQRIVQLYHSILTEKKREAPSEGAQRGDLPCFGGEHLTGLVTAYESFEVLSVEAAHEMRVAKGPGICEQIVARFKSEGVVSVTDFTVCHYAVFFKTADEAFKCQDGELGKRISAAFVDIMRERNPKSNISASSIEIEYYSDEQSDRDAANGNPFAFFR